MFVSMAIVSSLSAQAVPNLEVDNKFLFTGSPMCIPVNSAVDHGELLAEEVSDFALNTAVGKYAEIGTGNVNFDITLSNCPRGQSVDITAEGIESLPMEGSNAELLGGAVGTGRSEYFAVVHLVRPADRSALTSTNQKFSVANPTVTYKLEENDKIPMEGSLLVRGFAKADGSGLDDDAQSKFNSISNGIHTIKSKYTITMN